MPRFAADPALRARALLAAATLAAYLTAFGGGYQFDDWAVIVDDPRVHSLDAWWQSMPGIRPLLKLSYALNWQSGLGLAGFHAINLGVHLLNVLLVFALLRRLAARTGPTGLAAPFVAALLFALHPVQTEAVTYISGRSCSLSALFALASLLAWECSRVQPRAAARRWLAWCVSPIALLLALLVKETAMVTPAALVLLALCDTRSRVRWRDALAAAVPQLLVLVAAGLAAATLPRYWMLLEASFTARPLGVNLLTQLHGIAWLAGQLVLPWRLNADPLLAEVAAWTPVTFVLALILGALLVFAAASLRQRPALAFGIFWFFLWLAPTNSLLPRLDIVNDRQLYVALIGPAWLTGCAVAQLIEARGAPARRRIALAAVATLVVGLGLATSARNRVYHSEIAFWSDACAKSPGNARAAGNLGYALALAGRPAEAQAQFRRALEIDPQYTRAAINLLLLKDLGPE